MAQQPSSGGRRVRRGSVVNVRALEWAARQNISHAVAGVLLIELALLAGDARPSHPRRSTLLTLHPPKAGG